jgi:hypothetical protein
MGSSGSTTSDILVTNCSFGYGHGCSIGSFTSGGVSNIMVINCTFSNTGNGIKIKSERNRGGVVQNCGYYNLAMTNVSWPIQIYAYYEYGLGTLTTLTPAFVANTAFTSTNPVPYDPPIYRNITISNVTATVANGRPPFLIWGLPDYPASNILMEAVNITSESTYTSGIYNTTNVQFVNCSFPVPAGVSTFELWNADATFTNNASGNNLLRLNGITTNGIGNSLVFDHANASISSTNAIAAGAITLAGSTLTISNNLTLTSSAPINYVVGNNAALLEVKGNLTSGGLVNVAAGPGFTNGTYELISYTKNWSGNLPRLGTTPNGYDCSLSAATPGQINLTVLPPPAGIPSNVTATASNLLIELNWFASSNATSYNLRRSIGGTYLLLGNVNATNYADAAVNPGTTYDYVVSGTNAAGESGDSLPVSATPLPSIAPVVMSSQLSGHQLQMTWPQDHLGWRLQIQTNSLNRGLDANWVDWPGSTNVSSTNMVIDPANGAVFLRLVYP